MSHHLPPTRHPDHAVHPMFPARWSPRSFTDALVSREQIHVLLEAARWSPSASNNQPWRIVWSLRGEEGFERIRASLMGFNQVWAGTAAALLVMASRDTLAGADGTVSPNRWSAFDTGAAWMALALQAAESGLAAHAMGGFDPAALSQAVNLPHGHSLHAVVAVGHRGAAQSLPEALQAREVPNTRLPLKDISFHGRF